MAKKSVKPFVPFGAKSAPAGKPAFPFPAKKAAGKKVAAKKAACGGPMKSK